MLMAAFQSRSATNPHSHEKVRSVRGKAAFTCPQSEHILEDGNHLSILMRCLPCSFNLYRRNVVNIPQPLSAMLLPKRRDFAITFILRSSMMTQSYRFASCLDSLCRKSFR